MRKSLLADRAFWLLSLIALFTLVLGRFSLPDSVALPAVMKTGYWWMFLLAVAWVWSLWRVLSPVFARLGALRGALWLPLLLVVGGGLVWQAHERHEFKILADEALLLGTSQKMHLDRGVGYALRTTDIQGTFQILQSCLDKRPLFYPFAISVVHDVTGYRTSNPFWFNTALSFVFLGLLFWLGRQASGKDWGGYLLVLLAVGSPLLAQQATGGGFELLNLSLMVLWWLLLIGYLRRPGPGSQDVFVLTAVALASTRYESVLALVPTAGALLFVWWRRGEVLRSRWIWLAPLLLLPTLWLNQIFSANEQLWELKSLGASRPFGFEFATSNLGHALAFFFSTDGYQPNSLVLSALGFLALPLALLWGLRTARDGVRRSDEASLEASGILLGAAAPLLVTGLMMVYFWGQFDHLVTRRLGLPTHLLLLAAIAVVAGRVLPDWRRKSSVLICVALVGLAAWSIPVMAKNAYGREYSPALAHVWRAKLINDVLPHGPLVIDKDSIFWSVNRISVTPIAQARIRREGIAYHLRNHSFDGVYVVQNLTSDPDTGELKVLPEDDLGPDFTLEPVAQQRLQLLEFIRLSRVTAIRDEKGGWSRHVDFVPDSPAPTAFGEKERDAAKQRYFENWLKQLP